MEYNLDSGEVRRRQSLGKAGESVARQFLEDLGYEVLRVNFRKKHGEIDLIAGMSDMFVFCEVKTSIGTSFPEEGYGSRQQKRLVRLCQEYMAENPGKFNKDYELRFDLIVVGAGDQGKLEVKRHITDAFRP